MIGQTQRAFRKRDFARPFFSLSLFSLPFLAKANCARRKHAPCRHLRRRTFWERSKCRVGRKKSVRRRNVFFFFHCFLLLQKKSERKKFDLLTLSRLDRSPISSTMILSLPPIQAPPPLLLSPEIRARLPVIALARATEFPTALSAPELNDDSSSSSTSSTSTSSSSPLSQLTSGARGDLVVRCTRKCMPACIRGGAGAPGLGPLTLRKELVELKEGFRDRGYCLETCTRACSAAVAVEAGK